jgi:hypothetical protein
MALHQTKISLGTGNEEANKSLGESGTRMVLFGSGVHVLKHLAESVSFIFASKDRWKYV